MKPLVLAASTLGKPFLIYTSTMDYALGALLAQTKESGHEQAI